jgi:hypothetical protein
MVGKVELGIIALVLIGIIVSAGAMYYASARLPAIDAEGFGDHFDRRNHRVC